MIKRNDFKVENSFWFLCQPPFKHYISFTTLFDILLSLQSGTLIHVSSTILLPLYKRLTICTQTMFQECPEVFYFPPYVLYKLTVLFKFLHRLIYSPLKLLHIQCWSYSCQRCKHISSYELIIDFWQTINCRLQFIPFFINY